MTTQEACAQAFENSRRKGDAEGYARGRKEAVKHGRCEWCKPECEVCGTCAQYFADERHRCAAEPDELKCIAYEPIDYCPKCGRKLRDDNET